jgi:hypothetical protein
MFCILAKAEFHSFSIYPQHKGVWQLKRHALELLYFTSFYKTPILKNPPPQLKAKARGVLIEA